MARKLRVQCPGAIYHVMNRGFSFTCGALSTGGRATSKFLLSVMAAPGVVCLILIFWHANLAVGECEPMAFQVVYSFEADPRFPRGALVEGSDGNLYGPASGGTWVRDAIYQFTTLGALKTIFSFDGTNGSYPNALIQGPNGSLYGTTYYGGTGYDGTTYSGKGTVFKLSLDGTLTTLVQFNGTNGTGPTARLTLGLDGNFYGTTFTGGSSYNQYNFGYGSVFKLTPQGGFTSLASFGSTNGLGPHGVVEGKDGNLYGVAQDGGERGFGTFFRVARGGGLSALLSFNGTNGLHPRSIIAGTDGNFYGVTLYGGPGFTGFDFSGNGTVFKITPFGAITTLVAFNGTNGYAPRGQLVEAPDGSFYGTTEQAGIAHQGTVYRVTTNGVLTTIASFTGANGAYPQYGVWPSRDGNLYGVVNNGGMHGGGVIYRLVPSFGITNITRSNDTVSLAWSAFTNGVYRVEAAGSFPCTNWAGLSPNVISTGTTARFTCPAPANSSGSYRITLLPGWQ